ncbi:MAG: radical SAM-associated putative lipoprotein [Bacteroidales bacterium]|nr:radical SAM-associated putative lipoprotein [Bacteroidales bacterium]
MKIRFLKFRQWLLVTLMGALGVSGCHSGKKLAEPQHDDTPVAVPDDEPARLMYGVPTMQFRVSGRVTGEGGRPVGDIKVNLLERDMPLDDASLGDYPDALGRWLDENQVSTDDDGRFELRVSGRPQREVTLLVRDADGELNGNYADQLLRMEVAEGDMDRSQAVGMFQGTFQKEVSVKLKKKQ